MSRLNEPVKRDDRCNGDRRDRYSDLLYETFMRRWQGKWVTTESVRVMPFSCGQTICRHWRRSRTETILNVFPREGACLGALGVGGCNRLCLWFFERLASASISFSSQQRMTRTDS
jgi:hypothetical protein